MPITIITIIILAKILSLPNFEIHTIVPVVFFFFVVTGDIFSCVFDFPSKEFVKYLVFPIKYQRVLLVKNITVLIATTLYIIVLIGMSVILFQLPYSTFLYAFTYYLTLIFLFVSFGNMLSAFAPKMSSSHVTISRMIIVAIVLSFFSIPYIAIKFSTKSIWLCYPYIFFTIVLWRSVSIPLASKQFSKNIFIISDSMYEYSSR